MAFLSAMPNLDAADVAAGPAEHVELRLGDVTDPDGDWLALVSKL